LGLLRALRRAGEEAGGRLSCEPVAGPVAWPGPAPVLADAARGSARLLVLAGPDEPDLSTLAGWPLAGAAVVRAVPDPPGEAEAAVGRALAGPGTTVLVAVVTCQLEVARAAPLAVAPARCNRCGACLSLGCPAIEDAGGEAMVIDPAVCTGCARCAPLCRGRALERRA
jgi:Pyruvate/2-oxoacid:ferredoxin oxidoreductase delta subunit